MQVKAAADPKWQPTSAKACSDARRRHAAIDALLKVPAAAEGAIHAPLSFETQAGSHESLNWSRSSAG